jgi:hypothetical protein
MTPQLIYIHRLFENKEPVVYLKQNTILYSISLMLGFINKPSCLLEGFDQALTQSCRAAKKKLKA